MRTGNDEVRISKGLINIPLHDVNELMRIQASTLYVLDEEDKIVRVNESGQLSTPLLFFGKTRAGTLHYFRTDLPQALIDEIHHVSQTEMNLVTICRVLEKEYTIKSIWLGPAYSFPEMGAALRNPAVKLVTESNLHLLSRYFSDWEDQYDAQSPIMAYVVNGDAVSVCCSARKSDRAIEASLHTSEKFRGNGYAEQVVKEWGKEVAKLGFLPLYSTSWENLHSQRVAQKLGLLPYGVDLNITAEEK